MSASSPAGRTAARSRRAGAVRVSVLRALMSSLGVAVVVAADATARSWGAPWPLLLLGYAVLIWAVVPVLVTLAVAGVTALASATALPIWLTAAVAGIATAGWVAWGVGLQWGGLPYGLVLGLGVTGAGLALGMRRGAVTRALVAVSVAGATAVTLLVTLNR